MSIKQSVDKFFKVSSLISAALAAGLSAILVVMPELVKKENVLAQSSKAELDFDQVTIFIDDYIKTNYKQLETSLDVRFLEQRQYIDAELIELVKSQLQDPSKVSILPLVFEEYQSANNKRVDYLDEKLTTLEALIIDTPEKILALPLLEKDMEVLKEKMFINSSDIEGIHELKMENTKLKSEIVSIRGELSFLNTWMTVILGSLAVSIFGSVFTKLTSESVQTKEVSQIDQN